MAPFLPVLVGEEPLRCMGQSDVGSGLGQGTYVEVPEGLTEEEVNGTVVPLMLNCCDWARIWVPLEFIWTMLSWKPGPVGQPEEGPFNVVDPSEVVTFCFTTILIGGD